MSARIDAARLGALVERLDYAAWSRGYAAGKRKRIEEYVWTERVNAIREEISSALAAPGAEAAAPVEPDDTQVICPHCAHQFRAIPVQVQRLLLASGHEPPFTAAPAALAAAPTAPAVPDDWQALMRETADFLAELYAKYQTKVGPFASRGQALNVRIGHALRAAPTAPAVPATDAWERLARLASEEHCDAAASVQHGADSCNVPEWARHVASMSAPAVQVPPMLTDDLDLIDAVLRGYPASMARSDAHEAVNRVRAACGVKS